MNTLYLICLSVSLPDLVLVERVDGEVAKVGQALEAACTKHTITLNC